MVPWLMRRRDGTGDGLGLVQGGGDAVRPVRYVVVAGRGSGDGGGLGGIWLLHNLLLRGGFVGGHCDGCFLGGENDCCELNGWMVDWCVRKVRKT